ncbi:MAG: chromosome partitioning protein ParB, partial [Myxococcales bacterium]|nr:chromosome partitioning protein ParB [Myxococcales bacterium]
MPVKKPTTPKKAAAPKKTAKRRVPRKQKPETAGLEPLACKLDAADASVAELRTIIEDEGGLVVGQYRDPLGGNAVVNAILPVGAIEPTPFQRDLSDTHHKRLAEVIQRIGFFLDPVIAVTSPKHATGKKPASDMPAFWTPNGRHRLEAMRRLGAKSVAALV